MGPIVRAERQQAEIDTLEESIVSYWYLVEAMLGEQAEREWDLWHPTYVWRTNG